MREDVGRYLEGRSLETVRIIKNAFDIAMGAGFDVECWIDGRELVFTRSEPGQGAGFLRVLGQENGASIAFPKGAEIPDPLKRLRGVPGSRLRLSARLPGDLDAYFRRLVSAAYDLEL